MPSGRDPAPYIRDSALEQKEFLNPRRISLGPHQYALGATEPGSGTPIRKNSIPRKPVPSRRQLDESSDTILRHSIIPDAPTSPQSHQHFLGRIARLAVSSSSRIREAIAISYL